MENLIIGNGWYILTKSNCGYCEKVKGFLTNLNESLNIINCDEFLGDTLTKALFLDSIKSKVGFEYKTFPMVFHNQIFIRF